MSGTRQAAAVAEVGFLPLYGDPLRAGMVHAMRLLCTAIGVRLRLLTPDSAEPVPERVVISAPGGRWPELKGPRIVLVLPSRAGEANAQQLGDWVEPGALPVFGECERFAGHADMPWSYRGGGVPVDWQSRGGATLLRLGFDPLAAVFHWISLQDECRENRREEASQARAAGHPWKDSGLLERPWIDRMAQFLETLLDLKSAPGRPAPVLPRWPSGEPWALCLSHDVDMLFRWRLRSALRLALTAPWRLLSGEAGRLLRELRELKAVQGGAPDPWFRVDDLLELEQAFGARSTLLFLAESHDHQTFRYKLADPRVKALLGRIRERGFELGLHGGWRSYRDRGRLQAEKGELEALAGQPVTVTRQHWLRFDPRQSWQDHEDCGLQVDGSLGFNDLPGFRAGTSLPFHPWNLQTGRPRELLALPLALMDSQLFDELQLDEDEAFARSRKLLDSVRRCHGMLSLNWHPHVLCERDFPGRARLLRWLLEQARQDGARIGGMAELATHWRWREAALEAPCAS